jgi:hypothetical protein
MSHPPRVRRPANSDDRRDTTPIPADPPKSSRRFVWITVAGVLLLVAAIAVIVIYQRPASQQADSQAGTSASAGSDGAAGSPVATSGPGVTPTTSTSPTVKASAKSQPAKPPAGPGQSTLAGCASGPSRCGYPDAGSTGVPAGTALTVMSGDQKITTAGTVLERKDIRGCVTILAPNVTIRKSKISCGGFYGIWSYGKNYSGGGLLIEDVEVDCKNTNATAIASYGLVARRLNIHGCENGFAIDNNVTVENSFIHDFFIGAAGHTDGIQLAGGAKIVIRHNTILNQGDGGTSAIISNETGMSDVLVTGNLMAGGAYTLYCPKTSSSNYRVIDNRVSRIYKPKGGEYGPWVYCQSAAEVSGNVWDNDLQPLAA